MLYPLTHVCVLSFVERQIFVAVAVTISKLINVQMTNVHLIILTLTKPGDAHQLYSVEEG